MPRFTVGRCGRFRWEVLELDVYGEYRAHRTKYFRRISAQRVCSDFIGAWNTAVDVGLYC